MKGAVRDRENLYEPELNLRSTVFALNSCNCADGKRRKICAHAIALALHYEAVKQELVHTAQSQPDVVSEPDAGAAAPEDAVRSIKLSTHGNALRILVFLPPNLEPSIQRDAVVVKLDAAVGREILPLGQLSPTATYQVSASHQVALALIESWCGGKLAGLVRPQEKAFKF